MERHKVLFLFLKNLSDAPIYEAVTQVGSTTGTEDGKYADIRRTAR